MSEQKDNEPNAVRFHLEGEGAGVVPAANGNGGSGSSAASGPNAPGGPAAYSSAPEEPADKKKQGCLDACLGKSANGEVKSNIPKPKKRKLKPGEEPLKRFYFRLDKIQASFELALDKAFIEFEFGGISMQEVIDSGDTQPKMRKVKGPDGKETEEEIQERILVKKIQIHKPRADVYFTRIKTNIKPKTSIPFHDHNFEGYWEGPYSDLEKEANTVKLWHYGGAGEHNHLIGTGKEMLKDIVASKIDRELRVLKYVPGAVSYRKETMARLTYKLEFQEDYKYNIVFRDWELRRLHEPIYPDVPKSRFCGCMTAGERQLSFEIMQSRQGWGAWMGSLFKAYLVPCVGKRWDNKCDLPVEKEGTSGKHDGVIKYPGTRAWLEDESLSITLTKKVCCCIPVVIGRKAEELQGVLDYGTIDTTIDVAENINLLTCCPTLFKDPSKQMFKIAGTVDSSSMTDGDDLPIYRQLGNSDPNHGGLMAEEGATYLVVKVVRAKGLSIPSRDEFKETLNPAVTVHWNGMQKSSRVQRGTCDPYWDEDVHFKIMDRHTAKKKAPKKYEDFNQETRDSRITLIVWDNDGLTGRTALGTCYVDFYDVYFKRQHKKIISFASNGRDVERLVYQSGEKGLEAPFATDGAERKKKAQNTDDTNKKNDDYGAKFIQFLVYFDRKDSNPIPLINKKQKERDAIQKAEQDKKHIGEPLTAASIKSGRAFWDQALADVLERHKRFFPFYGIDEYSGTFHFLPSFLKPMQPPAELRAIGT